MLKTLYSIVRLVAYVSGIAGLVLILVARRTAGPGIGLAEVGFILLVIMFVCFVISYFVYFIKRG